MVYVKQVLRVIVGIFLTFSFLFVGGVKLTDAISAEAHHMLRGKSVEWARVWQVNNYGLTNDQFFMMIGGAEVFFALLLLTPLSTIGTLGLLGIMIGAMVTDVALNSPWQNAGILAGVLVVYFLLGERSNPRSTVKKGKKTQ